MQGAGRAGCFGQHANIFLLEPSNWAWLDPSKDQEDSQMIAAAAEFVQTSDCRVSILSKSMDGEDNKITCADVYNRLLCDRCDPTSKLLMAAV